MYAHWVLLLGTGFHCFCWFGLLGNCFYVVLFVNFGHCQIVFGANCRAHGPWPRAAIMKKNTECAKLHFRRCRQTRLPNLCTLWICMWLKAKIISKNLQYVGTL